MDYSYEQRNAGFDKLPSWKGARIVGGSKITFWSGAYQYLCESALLCMLLRCSALLLTKGLSSAKHSGIRSFFHQNFVKIGRLDKSLGQIYDKLYDNRQKSDYADLINFEAYEVNGWYDEAEKIVQKIQNLINEESD